MLETGSALEGADRIARHALGADHQSGIIGAAVLP
jgi:hypothetical protein